MNTPIILQVHPTSLHFGGVQLLDMLASFKAHASIPIYIHLDHSTEEVDVYKVLDWGKADSVMVDGSGLPFEVCEIFYPLFFSFLFFSLLLFIFLFIYVIYLYLFILHFYNYYYLHSFYFYSCFWLRFCVRVCTYVGMYFCVYYMLNCIYIYFMFCHFFLFFKKIGVYILL